MNDGYVKDDLCDLLLPNLTKTGAASATAKVSGYALELQRPPTYQRACVAILVSNRR